MDQVVARRPWKIEIECKWKPCQWKSVWLFKMWQTFGQENRQRTAWTTLSTSSKTVSVLSLWKKIYQKVCILLSSIHSSRYVPVSLFKVPSTILRRIWESFTRRNLWPSPISMLFVLNIYTLSQKTAKSYTRPKKKEKPFNWKYVLHKNIPQFNILYATISSFNKVKMSIESSSIYFSLKGFDSDYKLLEAKNVIRRTKVKPCRLVKYFNWILKWI